MDNAIVMKEDKPFVIFGRDITKMPCFRNSFLYGISSGTAMMLGTFLLTSRGRLSSDVGMGSFVAVTIGYWCVCRYQVFKQHVTQNSLKDLIHKAAVTEGTPEGPPVTVPKEFADI